MQFSDCVTKPLPIYRSAQSRATLTYIWTCASVNLINIQYHIIYSLLSLLLYSGLEHCLVFLLLLFSAWQIAVRQLGIYFGIIHYNKLLSTQMIKNLEQLSNFLLLKKVGKIQIPSWDVTLCPSRLLTVGCGSVLYCSVVCTTCF